MESVIVAYSGGADSAYLAWAAHQALGDRAIAVTADSASFPNRTNATRRSLRAPGHPPRIHRHARIRQPRLPQERSQSLLPLQGRIVHAAGRVGQERGIAHVVYGVNVDDLGDYRPGQRAAKLHQAEAPGGRGLTKAESASFRAGRSGHLGPPCLGVPELAHPLRNSRDHPERQDGGARRRRIRALGFRQFRVRFHGDLVRIEIAPDELPQALEPGMARAFTAIFKPLGFHYVTLDLEGSA